MSGEAGRTLDAICLARSLTERLMVNGVGVRSAHCHARGVCLWVGGVDVVRAAGALGLDEVDDDGCQVAWSGLEVDGCTVRVATWDSVLWQVVREDGTAAAGPMPLHGARAVADALVRETGRDVRVEVAP
ncbi:MAG: hypothetical protein FWH11_01470 [Micrococcales bacterium]|nr:hypothetical protein [Micrococcales bacterium]